MSLPYNYEPTESERQAFLASLLGDGYLGAPYRRNNPTPRMVWNMGDEKHAKYKLNFFKKWNPTYEEVENRGWGEKNYRVKINGHPYLRKLHKELYKNGKKNVTRKWIRELNDVGWAWFYGDDGHYSREAGVCYLHTEGYGKDISNEFAKAVCEFIGVSDGAKVYSYLGGTPKKERFAVRLTKRASDEFIRRIKKHMADGMEYKVVRNIVNN